MDRWKLYGIAYLVGFAILVAVGQGWVDLTGKQRRELRHEIAERNYEINFLQKEVIRLRLDADRKCEPGRTP